MRQIDLMKVIAEAVVKKGTSGRTQLATIGQRTSRNLRLRNVRLGTPISVLANINKVFITFWTKKLRWEADRKWFYQEMPNNLISIEISAASDIVERFWVTSKLT